MRTYNLDDIRALNPCYDPERHLPADWTGTIPDGLRLKNIPAEDRIWVAVRLIDKKTARLFAVWCARKALALVQNPDPRSVAACDVAERYAHGEASDKELASARASAWDAAWNAAWDAAWDAARDAQVNKLIEMIEETEHE